MMFPVRCFTCGAVIGDKWEEFEKRVKQNHEDPEDVLNDLGVKRYCCRRMFISYVDILEDISKYPKY